MKQKSFDALSLLGLKGFHNQIHKTMKHISKLVEFVNPKITLPMHEPVFAGPLRSMDSITEENNWERHKKLLEIQEGILKTQEAILLGQIFSSKLNWSIFWVAFSSLVVAGIALWIQI